MMAMGEWWLRSEKDPRFNSHGTGMVGMFGCPPDATERIRELERELECKAPDDLEVEYMKYRGERMRFIEIDGEKREVRCCEDCPCYDGGFDAGFGDTCKHPRGDGSVAARGGSAWYDEDKHEHRFDDDVPEEYRYGYGCPLREVPKLDPGFLEWFRRPLSKEEKLGYALQMALPVLLEIIAQMDPETKERTVKDLVKIMRMAQMDPEKGPLCTMDQEEAIKRGIEACTVKGAKG